MLMKETSNTLGGRLIRNRKAMCAICYTVPKNENEMHLYRYYLGDGKFACIPCARMQGLLPEGMTNYQVEKVISP